METKRRFTQVLGDYGDPVAYGGGFTDSRGLWVAPHGFADCPDAPFGCNEGGAPVMPVYFAGLDFDISAESWVDVAAVSGFIGCDVAALDVAEQIDAVASYYGWENFDSYPLMFSESEMEAFWDQDSSK